MNMNKMMMTVAVAITVGNVLAKTNLAEVIEIADGEMKWRFVPVAGTSQLPLKFMSTGKDRDKTDPVTMPKFWIAEKMITEGEFAALMGRKIREGRIADQTLVDVEWEEALDYCERFTQRYADSVARVHALLVLDADRHVLRGKHIQVAEGHHVVLVVAHDPVHHLVRKEKARTAPHGRRT